MTEDQDARDAQSDTGSKIFTNKAKDRKSRNRPLTKIIMRRLPPSMTEEAFMEQVSPIPEHDYFYLAKPDPSLGNNSYSRAYINFINVDEMYLFRDKFDGYVFLDEKGIEYVGIVEYAPFQRIPKKRKKKDPKCGTIESDPIYQEFIDSLKEQDCENQPKLEFSYPINEGNDKKVTSTPLLDYLAARKLDKRSRDERRRRENDKRKMRIERKSKETPIKEEDYTESDVRKIKSKDWEKEKSSKVKDDNVKSFDNNDSYSYESRTIRDHRKGITINIMDKKKKIDDDRKEGAWKENEVDDEKNKTDKRDKFKEAPRDQKIKKYSDTRKERLKQNEFNRTEKSYQTGEKTSEVKLTNSLNHNIKPFTQLPQVKTEDLCKIIEEMDRKVKLDEKNLVEQKLKDLKGEKFNSDECDAKVMNRITNVGYQIRHNNLESSDLQVNTDYILKKQKSLDEDSKTDREDSVEKEKSESADRRTERRIRNKDRPSLVIYQPGMGKFSKQRLAKEKETQTSTNGKSGNDTEKRDT